MYDEKGNTIIATHGLNVQENETFIYFSGQFLQKQLNTPEILAVSYDKTIYLQEDLGDISLLDILEKEGFSQKAYDLFKESLHQLALLRLV